MGLGRRRRYWASGLVLRGEIREVNLEPVRGSEASKRRPAVIVSNDGANTISKESVSEYREFVQLRLRKRILEAIEVLGEVEVSWHEQECRQPSPREPDD